METKAQLLNLFKCRDNCPIAPYDPAILESSNLSKVNGHMFVSGKHMTVTSAIAEDARGKQVFRDWIL